MQIEDLTIEITRECPLECEHCCRGEKEHVYMSLDTLESLFKDITSIDMLTLTGGEPLMADDVLTKLVEIIKQNSIDISNLVIIINGVVLSSRTLKALKELSQLTNLDLRVSKDIFHELELERLGLKNKVAENIKILREFFTVTDYGAEETLSLENQFFHKELLLFGRAKTLSKERLEYINSLIPYPYIMPEFGYIKPRRIYFDGTKVLGELYVDVYGNLVSLGAIEYKREDAFAKDAKININEIDLKEAIFSYKEYCNKLQKQTFEELMKIRKFSFYGK